MTLLLVVLGLVLLWVLKQVAASLITQQVRGSIPDLSSALARRAARLLPPELAGDYEEDWLAELDALDCKPLSAIRYARGLSRAARRIRDDLGISATSHSYAIASRIVDFNLSAALLVFIAPLFCIIALTIKLDRTGPAFLRSARRGRDGSPFLLLSFRTVTLVPRKKGGPPEVLSSTAVGEFLDRTDLDALPMFMNLLRGEMSLIGPPPQREGDSEEVLCVRPGIFSWERLANMKGAELGIDEARRLDRARSFRGDLQLLATIARFEFGGRRPRV